MTIDINIDNCIKKELSPIKSKPDKGWGYSFVYNLRDLRNIYLLLIQNGEANIQELLSLCKKTNVISESGKDWTSRNLLELVNAWVNFGYVESASHGYKVIKVASFSTDFHSELNDIDKDIFRYIYKKYYKFKEFHALFSQNELGKSAEGYVYAFSQGVRFVNCFLNPIIETLWIIDDTHKDMMRFWDVYLKWGTELEIFDKISISAFNINILDSRLRNANMVYLTNIIPYNFSIIEYIEEKIPDSYVSIIDVEIKLINEYHFKIKDIKKKIIEECSSPTSHYRLQSTSSNFIKRNCHRYFPMINNTYVSHLLRV